MTLGWPGLLAADHISVKVVPMVVMVVIDRNRFGDLMSEGFNKRRVVGNIGGIAAAADMLIQANDLVGRGHDQMEIVGDHEHAAVKLVSELPD